MLFLQGESSYKSFMIDTGIVFSSELLLLLFQYYYYLMFVFEGY